MKAFSWSEHFVTGIAEVDKQHGHLVELINDIGDKLTECSEVSIENINGVFELLADYAVHHFREEESLMRSVAIDARHLHYHREEHRRFLDEVIEMQSGIDNHNIHLATTGIDRERPVQRR